MMWTVIAVLTLFLLLLLSRSIYIEFLYDYALLAISIIYCCNSYTSNFLLINDGIWIETPILLLHNKWKDK